MVQQKVTESPENDNRRTRTHAPGGVNLNTSVNKAHQLEEFGGRAFRLLPSLDQQVGT
jgi:hypothetical protein